MRKAADKDQDAQRVNEARAQLRRQLNLSSRPCRRSSRTTKRTGVRPTGEGRGRGKIKSIDVKATVISKSPDGVVSLPGRNNECERGGG